MDGIRRGPSLPGGLVASSLAGSQSTNCITGRIGLRCLDWVEGGFPDSLLLHTISSIDRELTSCIYIRVWSEVDCVESGRPGTSITDTSTGRFLCFIITFTPRWFILASQLWNVSSILIVFANKAGYRSYRGLLLDDRRICRAHYALASFTNCFWSEKRLNLLAIYTKINSGMIYSLYASTTVI